MESLELKISLKISLQEWINSVCDNIEWQDLDFYCQPQLAQRMAEASYSVLLSSVENQHYVKREYLNN